jgi:SAM-dependent MidA family methyltransferase
MSLEEILIRRIEAQGPISIAEYMAECLLHPTYGYYTSQTVLGEQGDFITAPEISQMFGELIGLCLAQSWLDQGCPAPFTLAELGPGRGTLMHDIVNAARTVPGFVEAAQITLIEASPKMRQQQAKTLQGLHPKWLDSPADLPRQPVFAIANEFFDALPIRQFIRSAAQWQEKQIAAQGGALALGLGPALPQPALADRLDDTRDGDVVEHCPLLAPLTGHLSETIAAHGGAALIVDYGDWRSLGDTLQAVRRHETANILNSPGQADLTAHVDFEAIAIAARQAGCAHSRLTPQGVFLERLGITTRAQTLAKSLTGADLKNHIAAHRRLTHPAEMGNLFKVIGLFPPTAAAPAGLET